MFWTGYERSAWVTCLAWGFFAFVVAEVATGATLWVVCGLGYAEAVANYVATNAVLGLVFSGCGVCVAWQRPRNPIGWLLLAGGTAHATDAAAIGLLAIGLRQGWVESHLRVAVTIAAVSWPLGLRLCVPLALLLFPTGRLASARWRPVAGMTLGMSSAALQVLITLQPVAVAVAILRPQLFDIELAVSRALLYLLLSLGVLALYTGVVLVLDQALRDTLGLGRAAVLAVGVAVAFHPVREWLRRAIDRLRYGDRRDLVRAMTRFGARLGTAPASLDDLLDAVRDALRLPHAAFRLDGCEVASSGTPPRRRAVVPLPGSTPGDAELVVGVRPGQTRLSGEDRRVLEMLVVPVAAAVRATVLSEALRASRERLVTAREEERRRLRRDLHDGLGPTLTGLAFTTDAARNLVRSDPATAICLLDQLRGHTSGAIAEVRRLVEGLRPPALDELGLVEALRRQAERLCHRDGGEPLRIVIEAPNGPLALPAAVEVAAYRIVVEALTNAARHSQADQARVVLSIDDALRLEVTDNGGPAGGAAWTPGVGLTSMAERAAELAGWCRSWPGPDGGIVHAVLPLR